MCQINTDPMTAQTAHLAVMVPPDIDMTRTSGYYHHHDNCLHRYHLCHSRHHHCIRHHRRRPARSHIDITIQQWGLGKYRVVFNSALKITEKLMYG